MATIFEALPGIEVPVSGITKGLNEMWAKTKVGGTSAPVSDDARATQVNFVVLFGHGTTPEDAAEQFKVTVRFSQRCPARVVVLCPQREDTGVAEIRAKIYGECFPGKSKAEQRCCEFVLLSYSKAARPFLESQVSIGLSTDLPLYYWAHRFFDSARLADYQYLLTRAKRVIIDSSSAPADALTFPWPKRENLRDLVHARLLAVRQTTGQFLSRYPAAAIVTGLKTVTVTHAADQSAEGRVMLDWLNRRLVKCGDIGARLELASPAGTPSHTLAMDFAYTDGKFFKWRGDLTAGTAVFDADFGTGRSTLPAGAKLLSPEAALSEAMFF